MVASTLIPLVLVAAAAGAGPTRPLYASHCAALLEHQHPLDLTLRERFPKVLAKYVTQVEKTLETFERLAPPSMREALGQSEATDAYVYLELDHTTPPRPRDYRDPWILKSLRNVPVRVAELQHDLYAIQDGVVAGATEIHGRVPILAYLARVEASTRRNESELRPKYDAAHPYLTKGRAVTHALVSTAATTYVVGLAAWTLPSFLELNVSWSQAGALLASAPVLYYGGPIVYHSTGLYLAGFWSAKHREEYESIYGRDSVMNKYSYFESLRNLVTNSDGHSQPIVHFTDRRTFSETEMTELKSAAGERRAPSLEFAKPQERRFSARHFDTLDLPLTYLYLSDVIYFVDQETGEPTLLVFDRFTRTHQAPRKRKPRAGEAAADQYDLGGLRPAGL